MPVQNPQYAYTLGAADLQRSLAMKQHMGGSQIRANSFGLQI